MTEHLSGVVQVPRRCPIRSAEKSAYCVWGDFLLAPECPIEKVTLWEGYLYLMLGSETDEGVRKEKVFARIGN